MRSTLILLSILLLATTAEAKKSSKKKPPPPPPGPAWAAWNPKYLKDTSGKGFVAVGKTDDAAHPEAAEDDARQKIGQLVATWQEKTLACAKQASEAKVTAKSGTLKGDAVDFTIETATAVSLYDEKVLERATVQKSALVLMRHDLQKMIDSIAIDSSRSDGLRAAVKLCGEKTFDALAGS
ncbi:MAG: hypothetical protein JST54_14935 [Deltaproteobacteria bacterium]|nr:hypothetical protein [Deltaproteobacteria bacterium]